MKKFLTILIFGVFLCVAGSAVASPIYYQADNVSGFGEITYDINPYDGWQAPEFLFAGLSGTVDPDSNYYEFVPGNYTVDISLTGFWIDVDEDDMIDWSLPDIDISLGPIDIPALSLAGSYGALSWNFDPYSSLRLSYDFGDTGFTNEDASGLLAMIDLMYGDGPNGYMNADMGWDTFRVELNNTAPVPEPATILLMGAGLLGLVGYSRKRSGKKS